MGGWYNVDQLHVVATDQFTRVGGNERYVEFASRITCAIDLGISDPDQPAPGIAFISWQVRIACPHTGANHADTDDSARRHRALLYPNRAVE
jgi:hypothetical protein